MSYRSLHPVLNWIKTGCLLVGPCLLAFLYGQWAGYADAQKLAAHNRAAAIAQCAPDGTAWINVKTDRVLCARGSMRLKGE